MILNRILGFQQNTNQILFDIELFKIDYYLFQYLWNRLSKLETSSRCVITHNHFHASIRCAFFITKKILQFYMELDFARLVQHELIYSDFKNLILRIHKLELSKLTILEKISQFPVQSQNHTTRRYCEPHRYLHLKQIMISKM
jgi:hypothetical protein